MRNWGWIVFAAIDREPQDHQHRYEGDDDRRQNPDKPLQPQRHAVPPSMCEPADSMLSNGLSKLNTVMFDGLDVILDWLCRSHFAIVSRPVGAAA